MLRSEIYTHVKAFLGNRTNVSTTLLCAWINWAQQNLADVFNWRCLNRAATFNTVAEQLHYALPLNLIDIRYCIYKDDSNSRPLAYIEPREFAIRYPSPDSYGSGNPELYTWDGSIIKLLPIPSGVAQIEYWGSFNPIDFDNNTDTDCSMPGLEEIIILMAAEKGARMYGDWEKVIVFSTEAKRQIRIKANTEAFPSDFTPVWGKSPSGKTDITKPIGLSVPPE